jgi:hypothetical protein
MDLTVKKVTVMQNDRFRKQEKLGYRIEPLAVLVKRCEGRELIDLIGQGCLLTGVTSAKG